MIQAGLEGGSIHYEEFLEEWEEKTVFPAAEGSFVPTDQETLSVFPVFCKLEGREILIVGEGEEAAAKLRLLAQTRAHLRIVAATPSAALRSAMQRVEICHIARAFIPDDCAQAVLVFAATGSAAQDAEIVAAARARGIWANAVDRPPLCDFYTPALINRAPVCIGITSTGVAPVLARQIRAKIEAVLPLQVGKLADFAASLRGDVARTISDGRGRRQFWEKFFTGRVATYFYAGQKEAAQRQAALLLSLQKTNFEEKQVGFSPSSVLQRPTEEAQTLPLDKTRSGFVWLVGAGPGAEDLLTLRAQRVLQEADVILYDHLVPEAVVAMGRRDARCMAVGKTKGQRCMRQEDILTLMLQEAQAGLSVVRLKAGDPMVYGRAGEEIAALRAAGIGFEIIPGVTAALAAAASAEIPLTLRGVASSLVFATGHDQNSETLPDWAGFLLQGMTVAVYMGRSVARRVAARLISAGLTPETPVALIENASRTDEAFYYGTLQNLQEEPKQEILLEIPSLKDNLLPSQREACVPKKMSSGTTIPALMVIGAAVAASAHSRARPLSLWSGGNVGTGGTSLGAKERDHKSCGGEKD